jgi:hypothetical protein
MMNQTNYFDFCEDLFLKWNQNKIILEKKFNFQFEALPEPYLKFGKESEELAFLTTNPGSVMDFQLQSSSFFMPKEKYDDLSKRLAKQYEVILKRNSSAKQRIEDMHSITKILSNNSKGFTQFEISPFHSSNFPNKEIYGEYVLNSSLNIHREYTDLLTNHLKEKSCICIQAGAPDLSRLNSKWLELVSSVLSVKKSDWKSIDFKIKNNKATTGAFYTKNKNIYKVILFRMGSNSVPNLTTMKTLFDTLRS